MYPDANIVPVDYDPGASEANQTNRIKLLMTVAKDNLKMKQKEKRAVEKENEDVYHGDGVNGKKVKLKK